jgi:hypothetical protein
MMLCSSIHTCLIELQIEASQVSKPTCPWCCLPHWRSAAAAASGRDPWHQQGPAAPNCIHQQHKAPSTALINHHPPGSQQQQAPPFVADSAGQHASLAYHPHKPATGHCQILVGGVCLQQACQQAVAAEWAIQSIWARLEPEQSGISAAGAEYSGGSLCVKHKVSERFLRPAGLSWMDRSVSALAVRNLRLGVNLLRL